MHGKKALLILLAQYHTLFTKLGMILHTQWGGPAGSGGSPWTRCFSMESVSSQLEQADAGVGRGPGGPTHSFCRCSVVGTVCGIFLLASAAWGADFSGKSALEYTRKAVAFGPRLPASPANLKLQAYIQSQLQLLRCQVSFDAFTATTPIGTVAMRNIIAKFPGTARRAVAISGHFDTKSIPGSRFVGANDGGTSTGLLLELARTVNSMPHSTDIYLVAFDGEEAYGEWSDTNGIYGSHHLADKWA